MKKIISIFIVLTLLSCVERSPVPTVYSVDDQGFRIITIEGCEYLLQESISSTRGYMAHKGNCNNPIHEHNR